jgi:hypothetical protein
MGDVEEIVVSTLSRAQRESLYDVIWRVNCLTTNNKGVPTGIDADWLQHKLLALVEDRPYGETDEPGDGHLRQIISIFLTREAGASSPVSAFAVVCAPSPEREHRFHRLLHQHVDNSVYLAILCGSGATRIMDHLVKRYERSIITLDSLTHVIPYYLRPEFGVARMIDTKGSFEDSRKIQERYKSAHTKEDRAAVRESAVKLKKHILPAEAFTPLAECAVRGRVERGVKEDDTYQYAHIVILPADMGEPTFGQLCKTDESLFTVGPTGLRKRITNTRPQREPKVPRK